MEGAVLAPAPAGRRAAAYLLRSLIIDGKLDYDKIGVLQQQQIKQMTDSSCMGITISRVHTQSQPGARFGLGTAQSLRCPMRPSLCCASRAACSAAIVRRSGLPAAVGDMDTTLAFFHSH